MMNEVVLTFPTTILLSQFILEQKIGNAEVNSRQCTLSGILSDAQIILACTKFRATLSDRKVIV
jgi:hypothetical protein